jgi:hypothetical protein
VRVGRELRGGSANGDDQRSRDSCVHPHIARHLCSRDGARWSCVDAWRTRDGSAGKRVLHVCPLRRRVRRVLVRPTWKCRRSNSVATGSPSLVSGREAAQRVARDRRAFVIVAVCGLLDERPCCRRADLQKQGREDPSCVNVPSIRAASGETLPSKTAPMAGMSSSAPSRSASQNAPACPWRFDRGCRRSPSSLGRC